MVRKSILISFLLMLFSLSFADILLTGNLENKQIPSTGNLTKLLPVFTEYALLIGSDGTAVFISASSLSLIRIKNNNCISHDLPPVCNMRDIIEICIYRSYHTQNFTERMKDFKLLGISKKNGNFARKYKRIN